MIWLIPFFPLLGFLLNGLWYLFGQAPAGKTKAHAAVPGAIATLAIFGSFCVSVMVFIQLYSAPEDSRWIQENLFQWIQVGSALNLDFSLRVDVLSTLFTLVITGVGTLIHIYSIGYMSHDQSPGKFFCYLNLFCFSMLILVLGTSLPILFLGWEGVGLCSYLLIGYWYQDIEKAKAGKKAFIVNRIGDLGFLLGMFLIFTTFNTLNFEELKALFVGGNIPAGVDGATLTAIGVLLFVGCMGKSAQIPLYIWLPDAMAGPTPVSALIHAATMVTSGVYLLARLNFLYIHSDAAMSLIAIVGAVTALFAATIAFAQTDIKKVLAYSTVSQLGYMFLACGVGAFGAGVFHVITHAFFKALLFLGAGSVIHGMHEEQNILKMGGLKSRMPITFFIFVIGWLAICGIPPFSGFFSKDEILWMAFSSEHGSIVLWALGASTAVMTAFYMTRLFSLTFLGEPRFKEAKHADHHGHDHGHGKSNHGIHVHESPAVMTGPLIVLAILSAIAGFMGIPHASWLQHWLAPVIAHEHTLKAGVSPSMEWVLMGVSVVGAIFGIWFALRTYRKLSVADQRKKKYSKIHQILEHKWYVDEIFEALIVRPILSISQFLWKRFDVGVIDRIVLGFGRVSLRSGETARLTQTGSTQFYAVMLMFGFLLTVGYLVYGFVR
jgi:NADH-quinone oxidoreductase subunit L